MNVALMILWGIIGIINLWSGDISRLNYGLIWGALLLQFIANIVERKMRGNDRQDT